MSIVRTISIVQLILFAFIAVALPLVWAVLTALYQVDNLVEKNTNTMVQVKNETLVSRSLADHLTSMERSANQFQILGDSALEEVYITNRNQFHALLNSFRQSQPDKKRLELINELYSGEQRLFHLLQPSPNKATIREVETLIAQLHNYALQLVEQTDAMLVKQTEFLGIEAKDLKQQLLAQAFLALPITMVLGILFVILITKPIRQLDMAVRDLGRGDLSLNVKVGGPHDLRELGVRLNWLRDRLREVDQQKQAFLRNMSHELKTPLASIREGAQLLTSESDHTSFVEQQEIISIIKRSSLHLQYLIENLLKFNELTATGGDIQTINFVTLVNDVVLPYQLTISTKKLSIQKHIEPISVSANPNHIKIIVDNLLSNAVKFSPDGGEIKIDVKKVKKNIVITVQDSGPGISRDSVPRIFDLFFRGSELPSGPLAGNGLGLAIVKEIVTRLRGGIEVVDISKGALFHITLPTNDNNGLYYGR
ncbi:sensor histidine kinase [Agarilytica rhodophyticola]|uniref:sensor histidine kinase n=1 Tax=Agarilytica rhodophyticola TaxID=1737490 RepID=UPI000B347D0C|nr:HAMP domain-containing sensor histidine kinase [Agarilytica rhodophyticola]